MQVLTQDCEVIKISEKLCVYAIFKNGRSSLETYAKKKSLKVFVNKEIGYLNDIVVYLRDPIQRFLSGVNTYLCYENLQPELITLGKIERGEILDIHFSPQYIWLAGLRRFFNGTVTLRPYEELFRLIPLRLGPWEKKGVKWIPLNKERRQAISSISNTKFTKIDKLLIDKYMMKTIKIDNILRDKELINALS